jgi:hypothetical protein
MMSINSPNTNPHLKSLAFVPVPRRSDFDPRIVRRQKMVERLEQQLALARDANYTVTRKRRVKTSDGTQTLTEYQRKPAAWWISDANEQLVMTIRVGYRLVEFEKGKTGIAVGARDRLERVILTLIEATRAGELDVALEAASVSRKGVAKKK